MDCRRATTGRVTVLSTLCKPHMRKPSDQPSPTTAIWAADRWPGTRLNSRGPRGEHGEHVSWTLTKAVNTRSSIYHVNGSLRAVFRPIRLLSGEAQLCSSLSFFAGLRGTMLGRRSGARRTKVDRLEISYGAGPPATISRKGPPKMQGVRVAADSRRNTNS